MNLLLYFLPSTVLIETGVFMYDVLKQNRVIESVVCLSMQTLRIVRVGSKFRMALGLVFKKAESDLISGYSYFLNRLLLNSL